MISRVRVGSISRPRSRLAESSFSLMSGVMTTWSLYARSRSTSADGGLLLRSDEKASGVTTLTLNNPLKYNALSWELLDALQNQLDEIGTDSVSMPHPLK